MTHHLSPAGLSVPAGLSCAAQRLARLPLRGGAVVNLMANDTGNNGPGPAQVDLLGSFPGWLLSPRDHSAARGHLPGRTLPYGRERYEARWPLVMCLEEVGAVLRASPCKMAGAAGWREDTAGQR